MANIYVGFHDTRNSSRVLKPPGGGSSDIFGTEIKSAPSTPAKDSVDANNPIAPEEKSDSYTEVEERPDSEELKIGNLSIDEENGEKDEDLSDEAKVDKKPDTISSIIRQNDNVQSPVPEPEKKTPQRVPPGGYSSGLW